jgi:hypothetical protein
MEVSIGVSRHVIVENNVDFLNIDSTSEDLSSNKNAVLEFLEAIVDLDALLLSEVTVHSLRRKSLFVEDFSQLNSVRNSLHKDDNLIEVKSIDEVSQLSILLVLIKLHVVLLKSMESEFRLVLNKHFSGVTHELFASGFDVSRKGGSEHHNLLVVRSLLKDVLDVTSHV